MVRHKNRYIVVEINENSSSNNKALNLNYASLHAAITQKVQQLYGDFGVAAIRAGFTAKYCNTDTKTAIIRIRHGPHKIITSCLPLITVIGESNANFTTLYTGATIKQSFKFLVHYQQSKLDKYCAELKTEEDVLRFKESLLNLDDILATNFTS